MTTACLGMLAWNIGRERARQIFAFEADRIEETVFEHIQTSDAVAKSMPAFFQVSVSVEADEFRVYSNEIVTRYPFLRSVIYYPPSLVF